MKMRNPLVLGIILSGSIGMAMAGCAQTGSSTDRYAMRGDHSDCASSFGGSKTGTGAGSLGSSTTSDNAGISGCVPGSG